MKKYWQLFWFFRRVSLMKMMEYRTDFYFWTFIAIMWTAFNFFFFSLLLNLQDNLAGWSRWELYALLSVFTMMDALTWSFFAQNMWNYTTKIYNGELNTMLLKPLDLQFMMMTSETSYNGVPRFFIGLSALLWSLHQLGIQPTVWSGLVFSLMFGAGILFIYSLWFMVSTLAFWVEKLDNINEIIPGFRNIWQMPRDIYVGVSSTVLTVVVPLTLITSLPAEVLLNRAHNFWLLYFAGISVLTFILARLFLKVSIKKYSGIAN